MHQPTVRRLRSSVASCVESLEGRRLLANVSWDGEALSSGQTSSPWSNPINWSTNQVPGPNDDVTIPDTGPSYAVDDIAIHVHSLAIAGRVVINADLTVDAGVTVSAGGNVTLVGHSVGGNGKITILAGGFWHPETASSSPIGGNVLLPVDNYGSYFMSGGHDIGPIVHNYSVAGAIEGGNYYGKFINEPGSKLGVSYLPNAPGGPAYFGAIRSADNVVSAVPFENNGFVYTTFTNGSGPGTPGLSYNGGQWLGIYLDATPTLGGQWQASNGPIVFTTLDTSIPRTTALDPTFSMTGGTLHVRDVNLVVRGLADGTGLSVGQYSSYASVSLRQQHTSLGLLQIYTGSVSLGAGGRVLRSKEVLLQSPARLDLGDGLFIDGNAPAYGTSPFPTNPPPPPAALPVYADLLRATIGGDTLTVKQSNPASTRSDEGIAYAYGAGLAVHYPAGTFNSEPFDSNDFVFRATLRGDTDLDRDVDFSDLLTLSQHYGTTTTKNGVVDGNVDDPANASGAVNFSDLLLLAQNYGKSMTIPAALSVAAPAAKATATRKRTADSVLA